MDDLLAIGVVEDNEDLRESIVELLAQAGHSVVGFSCAEDVDDGTGADAFQLFIVDLNLPGEDGLSLVGRLKRAQPGIRIVVMTTRTGLRDKVRGYDAGADLYLLKPVEESELRAVVRAVARQVRSDVLQAADGANGVLRLDSQTMTLRGPGGEARLNSDEVSLLSALARAPAQRLEHWQILEAVGLSLDAEASKANLAVRMTRLRGKLSQVGGLGGALRALRGSGYQLCAPLQLR